MLRSISLTHAYPFMAMTFVIVPLLATTLLGEPLTIRYWLGIGLILAGMLVISS